MTTAELIEELSWFPPYTPVTLVTLRNAYDGASGSDAHSIDHIEGQTTDLGLLVKVVGRGV
ncbi:MAG: hypothetical protein WBG17_00900 [Burkholderiaceae bacterium]